MIRLIKTIQSVAAVTYKEWAAYRSHMLVSIFVGPTFFLVQYFIWAAIFENSNNINGFSFEEMIGYYAIVTLINYCIFDFADWNLQMLIRTGKFTTFLLRPISHRLFALSQKLGHRSLGLIFEFTPVFLIFTYIFKIKFIAARPFWLIISLILGFLMMFLINYSIGTIAFWLTRADGVRRMFLLIREILTGAFLPLTFFPISFQKAFFWMPFQYTTYVPIRVFLGDYELAGL